MLRERVLALCAERLAAFGNGRHDAVSPALD